MNFSGHHGAAASVSAQVQALSARNLQLLQAIEGTLNRLSSDSRILGAVAETFREILQRLQDDLPTDTIDRDGSICDAQRLAAEAVQRIYAKANRQHKSACSDARLTQEDGVVEAYQDCMRTLESLFDAIEALRDWIETHDALLEPVSGTSRKSVDDLFAAMGL